ncbi:hypothetical protein DM02DRAFT_678816 [Periconia macrospinosa]|uniref:Uncharacterized protein n=1 Tax=Periconia macrospinosa TaxID=97972 RepID=A0A2V1CWL7_9PLEO|nr:hypothetical protein DM02DRAFT_678816 [Periconia macrospinosa]
MDLFVFYAKHQVLVCKPCACAIAPPHLVSHIRNQHGHEACRDAGLEFAKFRVHKAATVIAECLKERYNMLDPRTQSIPRPLPTDPPLPDLKLSRGYQCSRCDFALSRSKSSQSLFDRHFNQQHRIVPRKKGRPGRAIAIPEEDRGPIYREVYCQRFFTSGHQSSFFAVHVPTPLQGLVKSRSGGHADVYRALVDEQLAAGNDEQDARAQIYSSRVNVSDHRMHAITGCTVSHTRSP